ncbi:hypothetical protein ACFL6X_07770 [Candidatus Latescibacterota bacterium]
MEAEERMHITVTGTESSGGSLIARTIAHVLGVSEYNDWDGMGPQAASNGTVKVEHVSLPAGNPSAFPDVQEWIHGPQRDGTRLFVLTVRDSGISMRSKVRRSQPHTATTAEEAAAQNSRAAELLTSLAASTAPHLFLSYETLVFMRHAYLQDLYQFLGVVSDFVPPLVDANERYLLPPLQEPGPMETPRPVLD